MVYGQHSLVVVLYGGVVSELFEAPGDFVSGAEDAVRLIGASISLEYEAVDRVQRDAVGVEVVDVKLAGYGTGWCVPVYASVLHGHACGCKFSCPT